MSGLADKPGKYTNFTGEVDNGWSVFKVKNATFELLEKIESFKGEISIRILFEKGDVIGGTLSCANIKHCNFYGDKIEHSVFRDGIFDGGKLENSYWLGGKWVDGEWVKNTNRDKFGQHHILPPPFDKVDKAGDIITEPGRYRNFNGQVICGNSEFYIENGNFDISKRGGYFSHTDIAIHSGKITEGNLDFPTINYVEFYGNEIYSAFWKNGIFNGEKITGFHTKWYDGFFKGGTWKDGMFLGGIWKNGTFDDGIFDGGIWESGDWVGGIWERGFDKEGNYHDENDTPNNWNL